jgi:hypothetical protein
VTGCHGRPRACDGEAVIVLGFGIRGSRTASGRSGSSRSRRSGSALNSRRRRPRSPSRPRPRPRSSPSRGGTARPRLRLHPQARTDRPVIHASVVTTTTLDGMTAVPVPGYADTDRIATNPGRSRSPPGCSPVVGVLIVAVSRLSRREGSFSGRCLSRPTSPRGPGRAALRPDRRHRCRRRAATDDRPVRRVHRCARDDRWPRGYPPVRPGDTHGRVTG